jgi:alkaline phosphatase
MLDEMTDAALKVLGNNQSGFVLMVEGAHIDKQSHAMDADRAIWETIEFDNAVRKCLEFAQKRDDTLVLVTADHECAGFSIIGASKLTASALASLPSDASDLDPSVPPARQGAVGVYDAAGFPGGRNAADGYPLLTDPDYKLLIGYGANGDRYETWLSKPLPIIDSLLPDSIKNEMKADSAGTHSIYPAEPIDRAQDKAMGFYIRGQAAGRSQAVHTASDIPLSAFATNRNIWIQFSGVQDNTGVFFKILRSIYGGY